MYLLWDLQYKNFLQTEFTRSYFDMLKEIIEYN